MSVPTDSWVQIGAATSPGFSKDGGTIFHLRGAGLPQVWAMDVDGGNARKLFNLPPISQDWGPPPMSWAMMPPPQPKAK